ncbi:MAG: Gfo/Idh/MocA family oxidoreductase [Pseudomonadota bacterium]
MRLGVVGCGYVFDLYMATMDRHPRLTVAGIFDRDPARLAAASAHWGLARYDSYEAMLADPEVDTVVNLTSVEAHGPVTRAALEAGKHVYSEKPFVTDLAEGEALVALAAAKGLRLSCAPSNLLGSTAQTLWKAVTDGAVGPVRLVYAEFDDNPVPFLGPETWRSVSGAPWPVHHEYRTGCTLEHAGYHLSWLCALFGPVRSVTAFAKVTMPDKSERPIETPDFTVATLDFESGVAARLTCSIAAPLDHRAQIVGRDGVLSADTYRDYECPVRLERFAPMALKARHAHAVRRSSLLQRLFGIGGHRLPLIPPRASVPSGADGPLWHPRTWLKRLRRAQMGQQDKCLGIAELAEATAAGRPHFPPPAFTLHVTEVTLAIQRAGADAGLQRMTTRFEPLALPGRTRRLGPDYAAMGPGLSLSSLTNALGRLRG